MSLARLRTWPLAAVAGLVFAPAALTSCGEPTAQVVRAGDTPIRYELPAEFTTLTNDGDGAGAAVFGLPGSSLVDLNDHPVVNMMTSPKGSSMSFQSLRLIATGGAFDPLDPELEPLPDNTQLVRYSEIKNDQVWGMRITLAAGQAAKDVQALVDRATDEIVVTEVTCTQACYLEQYDTIEQIQGSWSLEP